MKALPIPVARALRKLGHLGLGARQIGRMASAFEHPDLDQALRLSRTTTRR